MQNVTFFGNCGHFFREKKNITVENRSNIIYFCSISTEFDSDSDCVLMVSKLTQQRSFYLEKKNQLEKRFI